MKVSVKLPPRRVYLERVQEVVTPERFARAVDVIFRKAEEGDLRAFMAVAPYITERVRNEDNGEDDPLLRVIEVLERKRLGVKDEEEAE